MNALTMDTPLGRLYLAEEGGALCVVSFAPVPGAASRQAAPLLTEAKRQLDAYFSGRLAQFDLPLAPAGTDFEKAVWREICGVGFGQRRTYGEIASALSRPGAARAVGRACGRNPLLIVIPCHRIVGSGGKLTGYAAGLARKRALLALEQGGKET